MTMLFAGVDLSATPRRASSIAFLDPELRVDIVTVFSDEDLLNALLSRKVYAVGIDSPLSKPSRGRLRGCERILTELGVRFFPPTIPSMEKLSERGLRLASMIKEAGLRVYEVYPGGSQDVLCIPRKRASLRGLRSGLESLGVLLPAVELGGDELDAVTAAYTIYKLWYGEVLRLVSDDCELILPLPRCLPRTPTRRYSR